MDIDAAYRLNPLVALRPEPFGALAYHTGNRKLSYLTCPELVRFVRALAMHASLRDALDAAELGGTRRARILASLEALADSGVIVVDP
ncbi:mycofactocin biosynthesis chaperone MftB [Amycolatopsis sp. RTGN1]|jgi:putative mycofactocin binding protein MftB|uniref:mycofactocin biosynthesis chaperone MftB n=1 Tax=Amycolatopsis ponsaeliensis TaxID=2992142 RepID=UPI00254CC47B|nr:mycofactocin biosynthesis chaperone MftB [Amycolatopsis sp. RTGN1]